MNSNVVRIETLNRNNYDTWKLQMQALLIKNDAWGYVNGDIVKPEPAENNPAAIVAWTTADNKAKSDIVLSISPSELKQIKGCDTSRQVWLKLEGIYQSKGPARKATLLKQLMLQRMSDGGNVKDHLGKFFDTVDKLEEMEVKIDNDLLSIMLLYSLPEKYENFRCAIESRDSLPAPDILRIKIKEEYEARLNEARNTNQAMYSTKTHPGKRVFRKPREEGSKLKLNEGTNSEPFKYRCHRCHKFGHKAIDCSERKKVNEVKKAEDLSLYINEALHTSERESSHWCLDSGATSHLCNDSELFSKLDEGRVGQVNMANNSSTSFKARGTAEIYGDNSGKITKISLNNTLFVPELRTNLMSVSKITDKGFEILFKKDKADVLDRDGNVKMTANRIRDLYYINEHHEPHKDLVTVNAVNVPHESKSSLETWHKRMGHLNSKDLITAINNGALEGISIKKSDGEKECETCLKGKMTRLPFPVNPRKELDVLEIIHSDVCGPIRHESNGKAKYFATFIDESTRWCEVRFLKSKDEVFDVFKEVKATFENLKGKKIKFLQSDNGREYVNRKFDDLLKSSGIQRRLSVPYHPEQNGLAERKNRTLFDTARCLLIEAKLPPQFWAEAVNTANYLRNRSPTKCLGGKTPYEAWQGNPPNVSHLKEFGCKVFCLDTTVGKSKLEARSKEGIFMGYSETSKGYRVWITANKTVEITRDLKFLERRNDVEKDPEDLVQENKTNEINTEPSTVEIEVRNDPPSQDDEDAENDVDAEATEDRQEIGRRGRGRPRIIRTGEKGRPRKQYQVNQETHDDETVQTIAEEDTILLSEVPIREAISSSDAEEWLDAMTDEVVSIIKNHTWEFTERPKNKTVIGSRFVLCNKMNPDDTIQKRKARLVAQGFLQKPGVHFNETFSPVARLSSVRIIVAAAVKLKMKIRQLDVSTAYLNGELKEETFMEVPKFLKQTLERICQTKTIDSSIQRKAKEMLEKLEHGDQVCSLKKALYGLKQAGRAWNTKLNAVLKEIGAKPLNADSCVYRLKRKEMNAFLVTYVDDILIAADSDDLSNEITRELRRFFNIRDLGEVHNCLGLEFHRNKDGIHISQRNYITELIKKYGMSDCKPVGTPLDPSIKLIKSEEGNSEHNNLPYRELVGALNYLSVATRPDISFACSYLGQFNNCYDRTHWTAAKRVLRYLKGTSDIGLLYTPDDEPLTGFVDADWGANLVDRRSYSGICFLWNKGPVTWESRKQRNVALSTNESEYMGLSDASKEAIYLRGFLKELGMRVVDPTPIFNDNQGAIKLAGNPVYHARSKHIDVRYHFVRESLTNGLISVNYIPTERMSADILTKGLNKIKHLRLMEMLNLKPCRISPRGGVRA